MAELRKYGVSTTIVFPLIIAGDTKYLSTPPTFESGDVEISIDAGSFQKAANNPSHIAKGLYKLDLTADEIAAKVITVTIIDATSTQVWEDQTIIIDTYGHISAMHPFDLGSPIPNVNAIRINGDSLAASNLGQDYNGTGYSKDNSAIGNVIDKTGYAIAGTKTNLDALSDVSSEEIENAVWNATRQSHQNNGTFGEFVNIDQKEEETSSSKEEIAASVREELKTELARIDKPISDCCAPVEREQSTGNKPFTPDIKTGIE